MSMPAPSVEYVALSPMLIVFGAAIVGVLVEAFLPRSVRYGVQLVLSLAGLGGALVAVILIRSTEQLAVSGSVAVDGPTLFLQATLLVVSLLGMMLIAQRRISADRRNRHGFDAFTPQAAVIPGSVAELEAAKVVVAQTEVFPLTMFAVGGMLLFPASNDLLTMFVALEVFSLPLYLLCGLARRRRMLSQEAALKYFLLGAFSSAFFLFGAAMLYGYSGTLTLTEIGQLSQARGGDVPLALIGIGLVAVGLLFKVGAVPFHSWIPDVYQGAPTPVTGFMAAATKIAAFGALLRILYVGLPGFVDDWRPVFWVIAIATMAVGTVTAVTQTDVKRMLAYSAIAHTGFILTGVIGGGEIGLSATMFYLFAYGFSTLGAFAVVSLVRNSDGDEETDMSRWAGLGRDRPLVGVMFSLFLLAFAGIPLTSGFTSKFAVFRAAFEGGAGALVVVGVIASGVAAYFYVRVIVAMFFTDPPEDAPRIAVPGTLSKFAIAVTAAATMLLGIVPQALLDMATDAGGFFV